MPKLNFPNMRPHDYVEKRLPSSAILEPKVDGIRVHYYEGRFWTQRGEKVYGLQQHAEEWERMPTYFPHADCEAVVPGLDFDTASGIIRAHHHPLKDHIRLLIFDLPCVNGNAMTRLAHRNTVEALGRFNLWKSMPYVLAHSTADVNMWYHIWRQNGYEGMMIKNPHGSYVDCGTTRRSWNWMRRKPELSFDAELLGVEEGRGKFKGSVGVLIVRRISTGEILRAGRGKLKDKEADLIYQNFARYSGRRCEIVYQRRTATGGYRHPRYRRFR